MKSVGQIQKIKDPVERFKTATFEMDEARRQVGHIARLRAGAVNELAMEHGPGKTAEMLGISRQAVHRLILGHNE